MKKGRGWGERWGGAARVSHTRHEAYGRSSFLLPRAGAKAMEQLPYSLRSFSWPLNPVLNVVVLFARLLIINNRATSRLFQSRMVPRGGRGSKTWKRESKKEESKRVGVLRQILKGLKQLRKKCSLSLTHSIYFFSLYPATTTTTRCS